MLTLIEKPRNGSDTDQSRHDLITFGNNETFDYDYYEEILQPEPLDLSTVSFFLITFRKLFHKLQFICRSRK